MYIYICLCMACTKAATPQKNSSLYDPGVPSDQMDVVMVCGSLALLTE